MTAVLTAWTAVGALVVLPCFGLVGWAFTVWWDRRQEPWCNHDPIAVVDGVCECGERINP